MMATQHENDKEVEYLLKHDFSSFAMKKFNFDKLRCSLTNNVTNAESADLQRLLLNCTGCNKHSAIAIFNCALLSILILNDNAELFTEKQVLILESSFQFLLENSKFRNYSLRLEDCLNAEVLNMLLEKYSTLRLPILNLILLCKIKYLASDSFNRLVLQFYLLPSNMSFLVKNAFSHISFSQIWDHSAIQKGVLRNAEIVVPNFSLIFNEFSLISKDEADSVAKVFLSSLKSSNIQVSNAAKDIFEHLFKIQFDSLFEFFSTIMTDSSIQAESKLSFVPLASPNEKGFDLFFRIIQRETNVELKQAALLAMSQVTTKSDQILTIIQNYLTSTKVSDKKSCVLALFNISMKMGTVDFLKKDTLLSFFNNSETCMESIYLLKLVTSLNATLLNETIISSQIDFLFKIFSNDSLRLNNELGEYLLDVLPSEKVLVMILSLCKRLNKFFVDKIMKISKQNSLLDRISLMDIKCNEVFKKNFIFFSTASAVPEKTLIFLIQQRFSFKILRKFFYNYCSLEKLLQIQNYEVALSFLMSLRDISISENLLKFSSAMSRGQFELLMKSMIQLQPFYIRNNVLLIYERVINERMYFYIYLILHSFRYCTRSTLENVKESLLEVLSNQTCSNHSWLTDELPMLPSFFVMIYPILKFFVKSNQNVEAILSIIQSYTLSFENCDLIDLIDLLLDSSRLNPLFHASISLILDNLIESNLVQSKNLEATIESSLQKVIVNHVFSQHHLTRKYALKIATFFTQFSPDLTFRIWALKYDELYEISCLATEICSLDHFQLSVDAVSKYQSFIFSSKFNFNDYILKGFCSLLAIYPDEYSMIFEKFLSIYSEFSMKNIKNARIREITEKESVRELISKFFLETCNLIQKKEVVNGLLSFYLQSIIDYENESDEVISNFIDCFVNLFQSSNNFERFSMFYNSIDTFPAVTKGKVIPLCALLKFFPKDSSMFELYLKKCINFISFPNDNVQSIIACCLCDCWDTKFFPIIREVIFPNISAGSSSWERRGAAYIVSSFLKKMGLEYFQKLDISPLYLTSNPSMSHTISHYDGWLFLIEILALYHGVSFEPYIIKILPFLIACNGEPDDEMRNACTTCIPSVMKSTTQHGLCIILSILLEHLKQIDWKTQSGAALILGSMSNLAPRLLAKNLQTIITSLSNVLKVPHPQVQTCGKIALDSFLNQISTPEIKAIAPVLFGTIANPSTIDNSLKIILETSFCHYLQESDVCLLFPVIFIGLQSQQSSNTKRKTAQILGNILKLVDKSLAEHYIEKLIELLLDIANDCVAEVRSTCAKVLGLIYELFQLESNPSFDWLILTLIENIRTGKMGYSQILSEIIGNCSVAKFHEILPLLLDECKNTTLQPSDSSRYALQQIENRRCAFLNLFVFFASTLKESTYSAVKSTVFPTLLECLCDDNEQVRQVALKACQLLIKLKSVSDLAEDDPIVIELLTRGALDTNSHIRIASYQLINDFCSSGATQQNLNHFLSLVFIARMDLNSSVKVQAITVWKALVQNSAKTLKEILPNILLNLLRISNSHIKDISIENGKFLYSSIDQLQMVANTIQEICSKIENLVLPCMHQLLQENVSRGYCFVLYLSMFYSSKELVEKESENLFSSITTLIEYSEFSCLIDVLRHTLSKQIESFLLPSLVELTFTSQIKNVKNCFLVKGFMSKVMERLVGKVAEIDENIFCIMLEMTQTTEIVPFAEDFFDLLLSKGIIIANEQERIEKLIASFVKTLSVTHGICDLLISEMLNRLSDLHERNSLFIFISFFTAAMPYISAPVQMEGIRIVFKSSLLSVESFSVQLTQLLQSIPFEEDYLLAINEGIADCQSIEKKNVDLIISFLVKNLTSIQDYIQSIILTILHCLLQKYTISNLISIVGMLIRILGEKKSNTVKVTALKCLVDLSQQGKSMIRPFVPQILRLATRNLLQESESPILFQSYRLIISISEFIAAKVDLLIDELLGTNVNSYCFLVLFEVISRNHISLSDESLTVLLDKVSDKNPKLLYLPFSLIGIALGYANCSDTFFAEAIERFEQSLGSSLIIAGNILHALRNNAFNKLKYDWSFATLKQAMIEGLQSDEMNYALFHLIMLNEQSHLFSTDEFCDTLLIPYSRTLLDSTFFLQTILSTENHLIIDRFSISSLCEPFDVDFFNSSFLFNKL